MSKWMLGTALTSVLLGVAIGCSSGTGSRAASPLDGMLLGDAKKSSRVAPDLAKSNPKTGGKYQNGSSLFDYPGKPEPEPSMWQRTTQAVSGSAKAVAVGFQSGTRKVVDAFSTKEGEFVDDPISLSSPTTKPNATFHVAVARVHERSNRLTEATQAYEKALKVDEEHLAATLGYARVLDMQGKVAEAEAQYVKAVKNHPKEASAFNDLGLFYGRQKRFDEARSAMAKAVELQPERKLYRNNIATVLVYLKQPEEAFKNLVAVHSPDVAYYNVGFLLVQQGDYPRGLQHLDLALTANPQMEEARQYRTMLVAQMGQGGGVPVADQRGQTTPPQGPVSSGQATQPSGPSLPAAAAVPSSAWPRQVQTASLPGAPQPGAVAAPPGGYAPAGAYPASRY